jgi:hypothetical protein
MKRFLILVVLLLSFALAASAFAATSYPWNNHAAPYSFLFGNHFDTHQQTKLNDDGQLGGFFYIKYTGETYPPEADEGIPVAEHGNCEGAAVECTVGWRLKGVSVQATLFQKPENSHPIWCIDQQDMPDSPGYSHFHWLGEPEHAGDLTVGDTYDGYLLKLTAVDKFFFKHHGGFVVTPGIDTATHTNVVTDCSV